MKRIMLWCITLVLSLSFFMTIEAKEELKVPLLKKLKIENFDLTPSFSPNIYNYNLFVSEKIGEIKLEALCKEKEDILDSSDFYTLKRGKNRINIKCTNTEKSTTYTINVFRGDKKENTGLSKLEIQGYELDFSEDIYEYEIDLKEGTKELILNYETNNDKDKVIVKNNGNFIKGTNTVFIKVNGEKGNVTYKINVIKSSEVFKENKKSTKNEKEISGTSLVLLTVVLILIVLTILLIVFYLLFIRKKSSGKK